MITDEDYRAMQINCQRMEREMKAMRQTLLDDFAKAALIGVMSSETQPDFNSEDESAYSKPGMWHISVASHCYDIADAMLLEREERYGTR